MLTAVASVILPIVIVLAFALVPIFMAPVLPESRVSAPVVPEVILSAEPAADERESVLFVVIVVAPVPVSVALPAAIPNRGLPLVRKLSPYASVVPKTAVAPKAFPDWRIA